jgi:hypothetical protein
VWQTKIPQPKREAQPISATMASPPNIDKQIRERAAQLLGGDAEYEKIAALESREAQLRWQHDTDAIGRILRAHLFLERFMTENLQKTNPSLGSIEKAKLGFAQKIELLNPSNPDIADVTPGIRKLNNIRNRLAHQSSAAVTPEDVAVLMECRTFAGLLRMRHGEGVDALKPIEVLEHFARHASIALSVGHSRLIAAVAAATRELSPDSDT